jgi:hypothetical protein
MYKNDIKWNIKLPQEGLLVLVPVLVKLIDESWLELDSTAN